MEFYTEATGFTVGASTWKQREETKTKSTFCIFFFFFFTKMIAPQQKLLQHKKIKTNIGYCTYKTESAPLSIHVFTTHTKTTQGFFFFFLFYCWLYFLEASYLTSWYNDTKQINTYIYSTYREKRGLEHKEQRDLHPLFNRLLVFGVHHTTFTGFICGRERFRLRRFYFVGCWFFFFVWTRNNLNKHLFCFLFPLNLDRTVHYASSSSFFLLFFIFF